MNWPYAVDRVRPAAYRTANTLGTDLPRLLIALIVLAVAHPCDALESIPSADVLTAEFPAHIQPLLKTYCMECHDTDTRKGDIALDQLGSEVTSANIATWTLVKDALDVGAMPKAGSARPTTAQQDLLLSWIGSSLKRFDADHRETGGNTLIRRLNHRAYANMVHTLLGVPAQGMEYFPADGTSDGFDTVGGSLFTSAYLYDKSLAGAQQSLELALRFGERPRPIHEVRLRRDECLHILRSAEQTLEDRITELAKHPDKRIDRERIMQDVFVTLCHIIDLGPVVAAVKGYYHKDVVYGNLAAKGAMDYTADPGCIDKAVIPAIKSIQAELTGLEATLPNFQPIFDAGGGGLDPFGWTCDFHVADAGCYRIGTTLAVNDERVPLPVSIIVDGTVVHRQMVYASTPDGTHIEITVFLRPGNHRIAVHQFENFVVFASYVDAVTHGATTGAGYYRPVWYRGEFKLEPNIFTKDLTLDGPILETWPTREAARIFTRGVATPLTRDYAEEIVAGFMRRACGGTCGPENREPYVDLILSHYADHKDAIAAVAYGLAAALCSPTFLYLDEPQRVQPAQRRSLSGCELARQLAYALWSDVPDETLLASGESGKLLNDDELLAQAHRLLADPRSLAFREAFVSGWLKIDHLDAIPFSREEFPTVDGVLLQAAKDESVGVFSQVLDRNLSIASFLDANFTVLNARLAQHYGIPGVSGHQMRVVRLPAGSHRGGVLEQAAVLMATSNGMMTSPVKRGVFIMERILGVSPGAPPPNVPALAKTTTTTKDGSLLTPRERLAIHRSIVSCARCHDKIDPLGFGLENYTPLGAWSDQLQLFHAAEGKKKGFWEAHPADVRGNMLDGAAYDGPESLKRRLLEHMDQFARTLTEHLLVSMLGRSLELSDRAELERIVSQLSAKGDGLGTLMDLVVTSPLFRSK